LVTKDNYILQH